MYHSLNNSYLKILGFGVDEENRFENIPEETQCISSLGTVQHLHSIRYESAHVPWNKNTSLYNRMERLGAVDS